LRYGRPAGTDAVIGDVHNEGSETSRCICIGCRKDELGPVEQFPMKKRK
jgi:hypothetical protein